MRFIAFYICQNFLEFKLCTRHQKTAELLVANGADKQAQDILGQTALHIAVSKLPGPRPQEQELALRFISFLLEKIGVNPLIQTTNGETALHVAVRFVLEL